MGAVQSREVNPKSVEEASKTIMGAGLSREVNPMSVEEASKTTMGAGPSREVNPNPNPKSVEEASKTTKELKKPMDVIEKPIKDPGRSKAKEEEVAVAVARRTMEEPKKSKEELERPMEVIRRTVEEPKKSKEELQKPKEVIKKTMEEAKKVPHKYEAIMKEADKLSGGSLNDHIQSGIFLNNKKKKYWVEERTGHNCFMVFARELLITWSEDQTFWQWHSLKEISDVEIEVASLLNVCWLEVHGRFETSYLTPKIMYEVVFMVMMMESGYGWDVPVNLRLTLADGSKQQHKECLHEKPRGQWIELKAGELMTHPDQAGEMEFSLFEYEDGRQWKRGLVVKGAIIRPTK